MINKKQVLMQIILKPPTFASDLIYTARKRSLGQGNVFTLVCQSFCSQGVYAFLQVKSKTESILKYIYHPQTTFGARLCFYTCLSVTLFTGGVYIPPGQTHPPPRRHLQRAVRILPYFPKSVLNLK